MNIHYKVMKRWSDILSIGCIILFVFLYFLPLFYPDAKIIITPDFGTSDALSSLSYKYIYWQSLQDNALPFWTTLYGNGFPLVAHGTVGALFLPNLILYKLLPFVPAYTLALIAYITFLGIGTYFFLKKITRHRVSSLFGALFLVSSGLVVTQITHISVIATASLLPWVLLSALSVTEKFSPSRLLFFVCISSQQIFAGFPQISFMTHLFAFAIILYPDFPVPWWKRIIRLIFSQILSLIAASPQLILTIEYFQSLTSSGGFSLDASTLFSFPLNHILTFIFPFYFGNPATGTYPHFETLDGSIFWENTGYIGVFPLLSILIFFLIKILQKKRILTDRPFLFFSSICVISLLLMTGNNSPLYILYSFFPFNLFRVPSRFIWIFVYSLIALSTYALSVLFQVKHRGVTYSLYIILLLNLFQLTQSFRLYHALSAPDQFISDALNIQKARKVYSIGNQNVHNTFFLSDGWKDILPYEALQLSQSPDVSALHGVAQFLDTAGRDMKRTALIKSYIDGNITVSSESAKITRHAEQILSLYGIDTIASTVPLASEIYTKDSSVEKNGISMYSYKNQLISSRLFAPSRITAVKTFSDFTAKIENDAYNPTDEAIVEQEQNVILEMDTTPKIQILEERDQKFSASIELNKKSLIVLNQLLYPGWTVTIDGTPGKLIPVNVLSQGILAPEGKHTLIFSYYPRFFTVALVLSFTVFAVIVLLGVFRSFSSLLRKDA